MRRLYGARRGRRAVPVPRSCYDGAVKIAVSAPVRVCDLGGWTDTWFGGPGRVLNVAVTPGVTVSVRDVGGDARVVLDAESSSPLVQAAIAFSPPPADRAVAIHVPRRGAARVRCRHVGGGRGRAAHRACGVAWRAVVTGLDRARRAPARGRTARTRERRARPIERRTRRHRVHRDRFVSGSRRAPPGRLGRPGARGSASCSSATRTTRRACTAR